MTEPRTVHWDECPVCRSETRSLLVDHGSLAFVSCDCGLVYKSRGEPTFIEPTGPTWHKRYDKRKARRVQKARWQILDVLNHVEPGPLLDIGCSLGYAMQAALDLGLEAKGLDLNEALLEPCRERGLDVKVGDVAGLYPFPDATFSIVLLKHVFEHTPNPRAALRELRRVVKPGGAIFVAVPNLDYVKARLFPKKCGFFQPDSGGRHHFVYYTAKLLRQLVDDEGFRTVRMHPHLWHRGVGGMDSLANLVAWPSRLFEGPIRHTLRLAREICLVAVREP